MLPVHPPIQLRSFEDRRSRLCGRQEQKLQQSQIEGPGTQGGVFVVLHAVWLDSGSSLRRFRSYWYVYPQSKRNPNVEQERPCSRNKTNLPKARISQDSMATFHETGLADFKELQGRNISKSISRPWSSSWSGIDAKLRIVYSACSFLAGRC